MGARATPTSQEQPSGGGLELTTSSSSAMMGHFLSTERRNTFSGHPLRMTRKGKHDNIFVYDLQLDAGNSIEFRSNNKTGLT